MIGSPAAGDASGKVFEMQSVIEKHNPPNPDSDKDEFDSTDGLTNSVQAGDGANLGSPGWVITATNEIYLQRKAVEQNYSSDEQAELQILESKFAEGELRACQQLVERYLEKKSFLKAFQWLHKLAYAVNPWCNSFGHLSDEHKDKKGEFKEYKVLFKKALRIIEVDAEKNGEASYVNALIYIGLPDPGDDQKILESLKRLFSHRNSVGQNAHLRIGVLTPKIEKGCRFLKQAIEQGNQDALRIMKQFRVESYFLLKDDPEVKSLEDLANETRLITKYDGYELDLGSHRSWLELAAKEGDERAMKELKNLGSCSVM